MIEEFITSIISGFGFLVLVILGTGGISIAISCAANNHFPDDEIEWSIVIGFAWFFTALISMILYLNTI